MLCVYVGMVWYGMYVCMYVCMYVGYVFVCVCKFIVICHDMRWYNMYVCMYVCMVW